MLLPTFLLTAAMGTYLDCQTRRIPNRLLVFSAVCGAALAAGEQGAAGAAWFFLNLLVGGGPAFALFAVGAVGAGDGKLLAVLAGYLGLRAYGSVLLLSLFLGALYGTAKMAWKGVLWKRMRSLFCAGRPRDSENFRKERETICFSGAILAGVLVYIFAGGGGVG